MFNRVIREKDPKQALHQIVMRDKQSFETYKDGMAELNQRIDRELAKINQTNQVADRPIEYQSQRDKNSANYQGQLSQQRAEEEAREHTFTPTISQTGP